MRGAENNDFFGEHPLQPRERVYDWQGVDDVSIDNTIDSRYLSRNSLIAICTVVKLIKTDNI